MFSGPTLGALTSAQEGAGGWRQQMDSIVANSMLSQLDSNGDGSLSLSEIQNALGGSSSSSSASTSTNTVSTLDGLAGAFAAVDTNGDGQLSADELSNALGQLGQGQGQGGVHGHHGHHHHGGGDIDALLGNGDPTDPTSTASGSTSTNSGSTSTTSSATSSNTVSTLDGLTTADVAQALQAFLNSLAQSQAANLSALAQQANPTNVTA